MSNSGLMNKTAGGVFWTFLELTGRRSIGIIVTILLARFLLPSDYGLIAMISVFFAIANALMDAGFRQALIRKKDATPIDYSTMFYTNIALGLFAYMLLSLSAPLIAVFYNEPRLVLLLRVVGLVVIIHSLQFVQIVDLTRKLDFKTQFKVVLPAGIISGIAAVLMAMKGLGVWSLVAQMILSPLIITVSLWYMNDWKPSWEFSINSFKELFDFGFKLFLSGLLDIFFRNLYVIVIGKLFSPAITGYYFFSTKVRDIILQQFCGSIQKVTYPALSTIQNEDIRLKAAYRKVIQAMTYIIFPAMIFLMVLAKPLFLLFLKEKWLPAVLYLQLLCLAGLIYPLHVVNLNLLQVKGRSDLFLYLEILKKIMITVVIFISSKFGIKGILIGQIFTSIVAYIPNSYFTARLIDYSIIEQLKDVFPALVAACLAGGVMLYSERILMITGIPFLALILQVCIGSLSYLILAMFMKIDIQNTLWGICKDRLIKMSTR